MPGDIKDVIAQAQSRIAANLEQMRGDMMPVLDVHDEFDGVDEARTVRVTINGRLRVCEVEVAEAEPPDDDAPTLGYRVLEAYFRACAAGIEEPGADSEKEPPELKKVTAPRIFTMEEFDEAERRLEERVKLRRHAMNQVVGVDETGRVHVTMTGSGSPVNVEVNESWAQDVTPALVGRVIQEAFRDAYERLDEEQH